VVSIIVSSRTLVQVYDFLKSLDAAMKIPEGFLEGIVVKAGKVNLRKHGKRQVFLFLNAEITTKSIAHFNHFFQLGLQKMTQGCGKRKGKGNLQEFAFPIDHKTPGKLPVPFKSGGVRVILEAVFVDFVTKFRKKDLNPADSLLHQLGEFQNLPLFLRIPLPGP
jgi:hypothetical protein